MNVEIVERPEMKAAVLQIPRDGARVRQAWQEVVALLDGHPAVADREHGLVFIPEWQWATEVTTLWVGVEVDTFDDLPPGLEKITIPAKKFATLTVQGDRGRMDETYGRLFEWFRTGPYERDVGEGSLGYEKNRLFPVNPFDIPADEIKEFDYDIYAPIKESDKSAISDRFPGVIGTEVRKGQSRKIVGFEMLVNQRQEKPEVVIPRFWQGFMSRIGEIADRKQPYATIGLYQFEPPFGAGQDFRYLAGVEVDPDSTASLPENMTAATVPDDDCIVVTYRGTAAGIGQVWDYFHGYWRQTQSEYEVIDDYEFERHDERFLGTDNENSVWELHFPVRKRVQETRLTDKLVTDEKGGHVLQDLRETEIRSRFEAEPGTDGWVNVEPVIFRNSDLSTAKFENCDLNGVEIRDCRLEGMSIDGIPVTELLALYRKGTS